MDCPFFSKIKELRWLILAPLHYPSIVGFNVVFSIFPAICSCSFSNCFNSLSGRRAIMTVTIAVIISHNSWANITPYNPFGISVSNKFLINPKLSPKVSKNLGKKTAMGIKMIPWWAIEIIADSFARTIPSQRLIKTYQQMSDNCTKPMLTSIRAM